MVKKISLTTQMFIGLAFGVLVGVFLHFLPCQENIISFFKQIGEVFINLIKLMILPVVFCTLTASIANFKNSEKLSFLFLKTLSLYVVTSIIAICIGLVVADIFITDFQYDMNVPELSKEIAKPNSILSVILGMVPSNIVQAMFQANILQIIFFAILLGVAIKNSGEKGQLVTNFFSSASTVVIELVCIVMKFAPIGVFALIANTVYSFGIQSIIPLIKIVILMYVASLLHILIVYLPLIIASRVKVSTFFKNMATPLFIAFSTCSSAASLSSNLMACKKNGVKDSISSFCIPLGNTLNMDGASIYIGLITVFVACIFHVDLSFTDYFIIVSIGLISSIGSTGMPGSILIIITMVFSQIGIPAEAIGIIAGVDRIMDMARTPLNILGDSVVAVTLDRGQSTNE